MRALPMITADARLRPVRRREMRAYGANSSQAGRLLRHPVFFVGLDLGKNQDHSSLAVSERRELVFPERDPLTMQFRCEVWNVLRHLQRVPLHTPYPDVVELVRRLVPPGAGEEDDAGCGCYRGWQSGGGPVAAGEAVVLAGAGDDNFRDRETSDARGYGVPKRDLIVGLQVAFQKRWIRLAGRAEELEAFRKELMDIRVHVSVQTGYERYAAPAHDDLALAAALAWWRLRRNWPHATG
jgi:hypothetical protein